MHLYISFSLPSLFLVQAFCWGYSRSSLALDVHKKLSLFRLHLYLIIFTIISVSVHIHVHVRACARGGVVSLNKICVPIL